MLDKSIEHIKVTMTKCDTIEYPRFDLPPGFYFEQFKSGHEKHWAKIMHSVGEVGSLKEGLNIFENEFLDKDLMHRRFIYVFDEFKNPAAVASLWIGDDLGCIMQRLHWLAVEQNYQGKGLMKVLMTKILDTYNELGCTQGIYLTTQTWSYKAINVYLKFGFKPYIGDVKYNKMNFHASKRAWDIIYLQIKKYNMK